MKQFLVETQCFLFRQKIVLNKRLLCSFSGGQDSSVVFFSLLHRKTTSQNMHIIYCHHFWQPQNFQVSTSSFQLSFVLKIPYTLMFPNMFLVNENRSRDWRKKALSRFFYIKHPSILLTGHTQTDRLETNFNNLFRGTSSKGLKKVSSQKYKIPVILFFSPYIFCISLLYFFCLSQSEQNSGLKKNRQRFKVFLPNQDKFFLNQNSDILLTIFARFFNQTPKILITYKDYHLKSKKTFPNYCGFKKQTIFKKIEKFNPQPSLIEEPFFTQKKTLNQEKTTQVQFNKFWVWETNETESLENNHKIDFPHTQNGVFETGLRKYFFAKGKNLQHQLRIQTKTSVSFCFYSCSSQLKLSLEKPVEKETRQTLSKLAKLYDLPVFQDITNFSFHSSRNKIRHILFPFLGSIFQKKVNFSLSHFFEILKQENYQIDNLFRKFYFLFDFLPFKQTEMKSFENLLWVFFYDASEVSFQPQLFKKSVENFSERDLSFEHLFSLQKILLLKNQLEK